ncbi:MAG: hypothetical protein ACRDZO_13100 [Egibacteraceae bacterium]
MVDAQRRLLEATDCELIDALEAQRELAALARHPYDHDPDLAWQAPAGPDLPYDGDVPYDVRQLAAERRALRL